jgi:hypothetical protein
MKRRRFQQRLTIRLPEAQRGAIELAAEQEDLAASELIRAIVGNWLTARQETRQRKQHRVPATAT